MSDRHAYAMSRRRFAALMGALLILLFVLFMLSFVLGRYDVPLSQVARILFSRVMPMEQTWTAGMQAVVLNIRLPRIVLAMLVGATLVMCSYSRGMKGKISPTALEMLVVSGLSNGLTDFSQKLFVRTQPDTPASVFNFYTYVFSGTVMAAAFFLLGNRSRSEIPLGQTVKKIVGFIAVMALCLFANSYFKTLAAARLDSAQLYPLNQGAALILSMGMSAVFFKEKVTPKAVLGVVLAFVGLIVMNVL